MEKANDLDEDYVSFCSEGTGEAICESCKQGAEAELAWLDVMDCYQ